MSAVRVSPSSQGPAHDGKVIGKDSVVYTYSQVSNIIDVSVYVRSDVCSCVWQNTRIPSYLIAIAAGNVRYKAFTVPEGKTWSSGLWAEPELIQAAYWEFSRDTTK